MLSHRTKLSLCQYLLLQEVEFLNILLQKHGLPTVEINYGRGGDERFRSDMRKVPEERLHGLLEEVARTQGDLRYRVQPRYRYDERWDDLTRCLALDGYRVDPSQRTLTPIDPTIEGTLPADDALSQELKQSTLPQTDDILALMERSAQAFRQSPPDHNAALANARVALETLARAIARARLPKRPASFDETKWGQVLAYLRTSAFITDKEEQGLAGVYSFVSPGAHTPIGFTDEEMVRLGRSLVASMCYFLAKLHNSTS